MAFMDCTTVTGDLSIPAQIKKIKLGAFQGCNSINTLYYNTTASIPEQGFFGCTSLETVSLSDGVTSIGRLAFGKCESLTMIRIPDSVTTINEYAFNECPNMCIHCYRDSYAQQFAKDKGLDFYILDPLYGDSNADGNDSVLIEYYGMDDIDPDSLRQYRTEFRQENSTHVWNRVDDKTFLRNLGGYTEDRQTGREGLTLAGLMMFGKGLAIRDRFANFRMDYLDMSHLVGDERYHDRLTYDGLWENNLYQFFRIVSPKVQFDLPRPFKLEKGGKRNDDTPQHEAVREAFTNAIIHCDLMMDAGILRIEKHDDRLCFRNPGLLKLPVETIYKGGNSKARNPKIQNMLRMIGFGENVGSGFPKIIAAWKETSWGEPQLLNKLDVDEVELVLPVPSPKSSNVGLSNELSIELPEGLSIRLSKELSKGLSETAATIFKLIYADNYITRGDIAKKVGVSVTAVQKHVNKLKSIRLLDREGSASHGHWIIIEN